MPPPFQCSTCGRKARPHQLPEILGDTRTLCVCGGSLSQDWVKVQQDCGNFTVEIWSDQCYGYLPAGYVTENYRPFEEWKESLLPIRDGYRCVTLNMKWKDAKHFKTFREAQDWIISNNPFGIDMPERS